MWATPQSSSRGRSRQNNFETKAFNKKIPKQNNNLVVFIYVSGLNPNPWERQQIHDSKLVCSFFFQSAVYFVRVVLSPGMERTIRIKTHFALKATD